MTVPDWVREVEARLPGRTRREEPLAPYTTYRIGGPAQLYVLPSRREDVQWLLRRCQAEQIPFLVLGAGSNLLVSDAGFRGVVVQLKALAAEIAMGGVEVRAGAAVELAGLVRRACEAGLAGLECLAGIPGTVGGAAVMNAGAFGVEFFDHLVDLEIVDLAGDIRSVAASQVPHGYRHGFDPAQGIVLSVRLRLEKGERKRLRQVVEDVLRRRSEKQPLEYPSCGSVFKRPEGDYAGRLIEACGLKGLQRGGARVSEKHANFIVNTGGATASDVLWLIREVRRRVFERFGVLLEPEVRLVGFEEPLEELLSLEKEVQA
ncbi:MAG: UDP-N-acetylmuramate dehydrogenase [candidate division KSB1 bacterium]|nr:UDP-N-acetylmuramate dehydrogenase [candidate division KSB1 bacterium]